MVWENSHLFVEIGVAIGDDWFETLPGIGS
jgi:hypothetical protein